MEWYDYAALYQRFHVVAGHAVNVYKHPMDLTDMDIDHLYSMDLAGCFIGTITSRLALSVARPEHRRRGLHTLLSHLPEEAYSLVLGAVVKRDLVKGVSN